MTAWHTWGYQRNQKCEAQKSKHDLQLSLLNNQGHTLVISLQLLDTQRIFVLLHSCFNLIEKMSDLSMRDFFYQLSADISSSPVELLWNGNTSYHKALTFPKLEGSWSSYLGISSNLFWSWYINTYFVLYSKSVHSLMFHLQLFARSYLTTVNSATYCKSQYIVPL
jgi:hypothetical protein